VSGVIRTRVGFAGGKKKFPTYHDLGDHTESIQLEFDPNIVSYEKLLDIFWNIHNPFGFSSRQYMSAIFTHTPEQYELAIKSKEELQEKASAKGRIVRTAIEAAGDFYLAEDYHQKFRLRRYSKVMLDFEVLSDAEFIASSVASRLNGYLAGCGNADVLADEIESMHLTPKVSQEVQRIVGTHTDGAARSC